MSRLVLSAPNLDRQGVLEALEALQLPTLGLEVNQGCCVYELPEAATLTASHLQDVLKPIAMTHEFDYALLESQVKADHFKLLAMDMDSTLITIECIDEIADFVGKKKEVSEITEAAMRGEITDFADSLNRRVALLRGVPETALESVYQERLRLSPGAENLLAFARKNGWKTLLVSGGFTFFTDKLKARLGLDYTRANTLEIVDGHLTGRVLGPIIDGQAKMDTVQETCKLLGIESQQAIVMGDGANDLKMMSISGASVAFRAKPAVQLQTDYCINFGGLDSVCLWLS